MFRLFPANDRFLAASAASGDGELGTSLAGLVRRTLAMLAETVVAVWRLANGTRSAAGDAAWVPTPGAWQLPLALFETLALLERCAKFVQSMSNKKSDLGVRCARLTRGIRHAPTEDLDCMDIFR